MIKYSINNQSGSVIKNVQEVPLSELSINLSMFPSGIYFYRIFYMNNLYNGHFVRIR